MKIEISEEEIFLIEYLEKNYWFGMFMSSQIIANKEEEEKFRDILFSLANKIKENK